MTDQDTKILLTDTLNALQSIAATLKHTDQVLTMDMERDQERREVDDAASGRVSDMKPITLMPSKGLMFKNGRLVD